MCHKCKSKIENWFEIVLQTKWFDLSIILQAILAVANYKIYCYIFSIGSKELFLVFWFFFLFSWLSLFIHLFNFDFFLKSLKVNKIKYTVRVRCVSVCVWVFQKRVNVLFKKKKIHSTNFQKFQSTQLIRVLLPEWLNKLGLTLDTSINCI